MILSLICGKFHSMLVISRFNIINYSDKLFVNQFHSDVSL